MNGATNATATNATATNATATDTTATDAAETNTTEFEDATVSAMCTLARAGLTVQDLLDELPAVRAAVVAEAYGIAFMHELERLHAARQKA
jgi:hypothetical protein